MTNTSTTTTIHHSLPVLSKPDEVLQECHQEIFHNNENVIYRSKPVTWEELLNEKTSHRYEKCLSPKIIGVFIRQGWPCPTTDQACDKDGHVENVTLFWLSKTHTAALVFTDDGLCGMCIDNRKNP